jgi:hypothetical protein
VEDLMAFLRIDGYEVDALIDDYDMDDATVESYGRSAFSDTTEGVTYSPKKRISFETPPMAIEEALALEGWVRGDGHRWMFAKTIEPGTGVTTTFTRTSSDAAYSMTGASTYGSTVSTLWGNQAFSLAIVPGGTSAVTVPFGSEGNWTIHGYHLAASDGPWKSFAAKSYNGAVVHYINGASIATVPFLSYSAASGYLGVVLEGANSSNTNATTQYTAVTVDRFAWVSGMLLAAATVGWGLASTGYTRRPFVVVTGDALQGRYVPSNGAGELGPMVAKGFTESFPTKPVVVDGGFRYNARSVRVRLEQK